MTATDRIDPCSGAGDGRDRGADGAGISEDICPRGLAAVRADAAHGDADADRLVHGADGCDTALDIRDHERVQERAGDSG